MFRSDPLGSYHLHFLCTCGLLCKSVNIYIYISLYIHLVDMHFFLEVSTCFKSGLISKGSKHRSYFPFSAPSWVSRSTVQGPKCRTQSPGGAPNATNSCLHLKHPGSFRRQPKQRGAKVVPRIKRPGFWIWEWSLKQPGHQNCHTPF